MIKSHCAAKRLTMSQRSRIGAAPSRVPTMPRFAAHWLLRALRPRHILGVRGVETEQRSAQLMTPARPHPTPAYAGGFPLGDVAGVSCFEGLWMAERNKPLPFLRWYVTDYRASRRVQRLTWQERGIYRELMDECWIEGSIPDDIDRLAALADCPKGVMAEAWVNIKPMFASIEGMDGMYLTSRRLETERSDDDAFRVGRAIAGRKGGLAKASKAKLSLANPSQQLEQLEQLEQSKAGEGASAVAAQPLGGAAAPAELMATPEQIRAIRDGLKRSST